MFPDIFLVYKAFNQITNTTWGSDLKHIRVDPNSTSWVAADNLAAPENSTGIIDIAPARGAFGKGLYVLYYDSKGKSRSFARFIAPNMIKGEPDVTHVLSLACPDGM